MAVTWKIRSSAATMNAFDWIVFITLEDGQKYRGEIVYMPKPEPGMEPTLEQAFDDIWPNAPVPFSEQALVDYFLMVRAARVKKSLLQQFNTSRGYMISAQALKHDKLAEMVDAYAAGVPVEDIIA